MTNAALKQLLSHNELIDLQRSDQDFAHELRLMLRDKETGELGLLTVRPDALVLPNELMLDYTYEVQPQ